MNARTVRLLLRRPVRPAIVPFLLESIDHMDPTRSHESKPSVRIREARHARRLWRSLFFTAMACIALAALFSALN